MIYKKQSSFFGQYISLLKDYYHVSSTSNVFRAMLKDFAVSVLLFSGTGLLRSFVKGFLGRIFIRSGFPLLIGSRFKVMHPENIRLGHHVWIRDDVTLVANKKMEIGNDTIIGERSTIWSEGKLAIGNNVGIGKNNYIAELGGSIQIGNNVLIADSVRIYSISHTFEDPSKIILLQGYTKHTIIIKDNVWIGSGAVIFNDVTIHEGAVIGANTVVNKDVPAFSVFAGNPGKVIKTFKKRTLIKKR